MKTQNKHKLDFRKHSIIELNEESMKEVSGGTWTITTVPCGIAISISVISITITTKEATEKTVE